MKAPITILDVPFYNGSLDEAVEHIVRVCKYDHERSNRIISATSAHGLIAAKHNPQFAELLQSFFLNLPDGMPTAWVGRLKGAKRMQRCRGPDLFPGVMARTAFEPINHFFCGGKEGVAKRLKEVCVTTFRNGNCVGTFSPPFRPMSSMELDELASEINSKGVDIVWVGISTPKQELLAFQLASRLMTHFIITVGAAFDIHIGSSPNAPRIMQKLGLEWLFRLLMEPRRLFKRYATIIPLFIFYNIKDFIRYVHVGRE